MEFAENGNSIGAMPELAGDIHYVGSSNSRALA